MDTADKLAAAIFAAAKCSAMSDHEPNSYLDRYDEFIRLMKERKEASKKPMEIPDEFLEKLKKKRRR
ncbi:hypothetical protein SAMN05519103_09113 [Rhizobiales bacterium GAS113]|nr:hypothetical protein SAMN05519103_09113 [Rhizobiales bacterium GAS113]